MGFATAINCMDGRVQLPVNEYLQNKFGVEYIDTITEAGPVAILAEQRNSALTDSIIKRLDISVNKHKSVGVAIVAHYDCAGNPVDEEKQKSQLQNAVKFIKTHYPGTTVIGLWLNLEFKVSEFE